MKHVTKQFVTAGDATFTIEVPASLQAAPHNYAAHYTYRVQRVEATERWPAAWFAKVLTGPDNEADFTYLGKLDDFTGQTRTTAKSARWADTKQLKLLNRVLARVWGDDHAAYEAAGFRTHHEGRCGRCNRKLTTPESVERGIGPECAEIMGLAPQPAPAPAPAPAANGTDAAAKPAKAKRRRKKVAAGVSNGPDRVDD